MINLAFLKNKKIGVFGLGISGQASVTALVESGAIVFVADENKDKMAKLKEQNLARTNVVEAEEFPWHELEFLVLSPGVPLHYPKPHKVVLLANQVKCKIICDIELLYLACPDAKYIGITGTNGKSTTTSLIGHILKEAGLKVEVGGNLGIPALSMQNLGKDGIYVLEMSSYQLDLIDKLRFNISVLLNITPDHIDRHKDLQGYIKAKANIFKRQKAGDVAVIAIDDDNTRDIVLNLQKSQQDLNILTVSCHNRDADISVITGFLHDHKSNIASLELGYLRYLPGVHNSQNIAASYAACLSIGVNEAAIIAGIKSFRGLKHRMQYLGKVAGRIFINDSKATNAEAAAKALDSFDNIYWIIGGLPKEGGISSLDNYFKKIKKAYLMGQATDEFARFLDGKLDYAICGNLENAFANAVKDSAGNDNAVILLSPACASFDQWPSFEVRGDAFINYYNSFNEDAEKKLGMAGAGAPHPAV